MKEEIKNKYSRQRRLQRLRRDRERKRLKLKLRLIFSGIVVVIAVILIFLLRGVFEKRADTSTMTVTGSQIVYEEVAPIGELDFSELKDFVKEETASHDGVKLLRISKVKDSAYVRTGYKDISTYSDFTGYECFLGTVADALRAGYDFDTAFTAVEGGAADKSAKGKTVTKQSDARVLIIRENGRFVVDGDIAYVSSEGTSVVDAHTVDIVADEADAAASGLNYIVYK